LDEKHNSSFGRCRKETIGGRRMNEWLEDILYPTGVKSMREDDE